MKIGDKVVVIEPYDDGPHGPPIGTIGTIMRKDNMNWGVAFDNALPEWGLHKLDGRLKTNSGWFCPPRILGIASWKVRYK